MPGMLDPREVVVLPSSWPLLVKMTQAEAGDEAMRSSSETSLSTQKKLQPSSEPMSTIARIVHSLAQPQWQHDL